MTSVTRTIRLDIVFAGLLLAIVLLIAGGCDFVRAIASDPKLVACAANEAEDLKSAIQSPKEDSGWIAAAFQLLACAPAVINDYQRSKQLATSGDFMPATLPEYQIQRLRVIKWLYRGSP